MPPLSSTTARLRLLVAFGAEFDPEFDSMTSSQAEQPLPSDFMTVDGISLAARQSTPR
jgi:hypothetical protein